MKTMSRDARKVLTALADLTGRPWTMEDLFVAERLVFTYYAKQITAIIKQMHAKSKSEQRDGLAYYVKPVLSMMKQRRLSDEWEMSDNERRVYWLITTAYLLEDFSHDHLRLIRDLCGHRYEDIQEAVKIGRQEEVFSVPYVLRITEGMTAKRKHQEAQIEKRRELFHVEQNDTVHARSRLDIASLDHGWRQMVENADLQERVNRLYGEDE